MPVKDPIKSLRLKEFELNALLQVTKAINENLKREQLYNLFRDILSNQLKIGRAALFHDDNGWQCALKYGVRGRGIVITRDKELFSMNEVTETKQLSEVWTHSFDYIIPVFHKKEPLAYLLVGEIKAAKEEITDNYLPFLQTLTNIIVVAIENKKLFKENIRQEGIKKELELASQMQAMLFPDAGSLPKDDKIEIAAFYKPHHQIGGDYYDYIRLNDEEMLFCLADVSGKGITAALLMANFQANLRAICSYNTSLKDIVTVLNKKVMESAKGEMFITLFIAKYNMAGKTLNFINAGHPPPVFLNGNAGPSENNVKNGISWLKDGSAGLGMINSLPQLKEGSFTTSAGDLLICYTDGVIELENPQQQPFGTDRLVRLITDNRTSRVNDINYNISKELERHKGRQPYLDDIALMSCRFY